MDARLTEKKRSTTKFSWAIIGALCSWVLLQAYSSQNAFAETHQFNHSKICDAIQNGWELVLFYRPGEGERVVVPRFLGYTKARDILLNGVQISGFSETGKLPGHRSFRLDRIQELHFTTKVTSRPSGSARTPSGISELICLSRTE